MMVASVHSYRFPLGNMEDFPRYRHSSCSAMAFLDMALVREIRPVVAHIAAMRKRSVHWALDAATMDPKIGHAVLRACRFYMYHMLCSSSMCRIVDPSAASNTSIRDCADDFAPCYLCLLKK